MCITSKRADLSKTKILSYKLDNGKHLLSYKNIVKNRAGVPNCMLLAIPGKVTKEDFIDTTSFGDFFKDFETSMPRERSLSKSFATLDFSEPVHLTLGLYEILIAENAKDIPGAIEKISQEKRPEIDQELINWFSNYYAGWNIVLCCFNENIESQPIMFTYEPKDPDFLYFPAVDSHGETPDLEEFVEVDHSLYYNGSHFDVVYSKEVPNYMPKSLSMTHYTDVKMRNGDWFFDIKNHKLNRVQPKMI